MLQFYQPVSYSSKVWPTNFISQLSLTNFIPPKNQAAFFIDNFIHSNSSMKNDMGKLYVNAKLFWINDTFTNIESTWMVMILKYISFHVHFFFFRPCILVFDSLAGQNRSRIVSILKEWVLSIKSGFLWEINGLGSFYAFW